MIYQNLTSVTIQSYRHGTQTKVFYNNPLIIAYPVYSAIWKVDDDLSAIWPTALSERIDKIGTEAIHVGFKKEPIMDAMPRLTVNCEHLSNGRNAYYRDAYVKWRILI